MNQSFQKTKQLDLFSNSHAKDNMSSKRQEESMQDAKVVFYQDFFQKNEADELMKKLMNEIEWRQDKMKIYGREVNLPRLTAWYGDEGKSYTFSGISLSSLPWTSTLLLIKNRIETISETCFNSVLLNYYRDGSDGISWHTDAEPELGENPVIASVSFGGTRKIMFRYIKNHELRNEILLTHGSFLLMTECTQHFWQHQIPKTKKKVEPRINLTFRVIYS